jgi:hypothetical protein
MRHGTYYQKERTGVNRIIVFAVPPLLLRSALTLKIFSPILCSEYHPAKGGDRCEAMVEFFFYFLIVSTIIAVAFSLFYWIKEKKHNRRGNGND